MASQTPVVSRRASDLLSCFVGGTEANIAAAFEEAERSRALLLIDEVDSFLFNRSGADHSWETSMVNEMLTAMELLQTPLVATTNLAERLDPAVQRRFTLHVRLRCMTPSAAAKLFKEMFGMAPPEHTEPLEGLTPADFSVVSQRWKLLQEIDPGKLIEWLRAEAEARGVERVSTGFRVRSKEALE